MTHHGTPDPAPSTDPGELTLRDVARLRVGPDELLVIRADLDDDAYELALDYLRSTFGMSARVLILDRNTTLDVVKFTPPPRLDLAQ